MDLRASLAVGTLLAHIQWFVLCTHPMICYLHTSSDLFFAHVQWFVLCTHTVIYSLHTYNDFFLFVCLFFCTQWFVLCTHTMICSLHTYNDFLIFFGTQWFVLCTHTMMYSLHTYSDLLFAHIQWFLLFFVLFCFSCCTRPMICFSILPLKKKYKSHESNRWHPLQNSVINISTIP